MASQTHSPQLRTRKPLLQQQQQQQQPSTSSSILAPARRDRERESSPSPSLREQQQQQQQAQRQRYARTQSMPIVATQTQAQDFDFEFDLRDDPLSSSSSSSQQGQQAPATPYAQQRPVPISRASQPAYIQGRPPVGIGVGAVGAGVAEKWQMTDDLQADIDRADLLHQQQQQHAAQRQQQSHSPVGLGGVALITIPPPGANPAPGTAGVAYAGGAASAGAAFVGGHVKSLSGSGAGVGVGVGDVMEGSSPGGASASASASAASSAALARRRTIANEQSAHRASPLSYALRKGANTSPGYPGMTTTTTSMPSPRSLKNRTPDRSLPVQEEPDEHDQQAQAQQAHHQGTGSGRVTPASAASSDHNPAKDLDHDGEGTLVDLSNDDDDDDDDDDEESEERGGKDGNRGAGSGAGTQESTEGEGSHTPRSPTNPLYPQSHGAHAHAHLHGHTLRSQRSIHEVLLPDKQTHLNGNKPIAPSSTSAPASNYRNGFNTQDFQQTLKKLQQSTSQSSSPYPTYPPYAPTSTHPPSIPPPPFSPFSRAEFSRNESRGSYPNWMFDFYHNYPAEDVLTGVNGGGGGAGDGYYEYDEAAAAASAYLQQFLPASGGAGTGTGVSASSGSSAGHVYPYGHVQGHAHMRPDAPIPPTPHSQTSAPTPFRRQHQQTQQAQRHGSQDSRERSGSRVPQENEVANEDAEGEEEEEEEQDGGRDVVDDSIVNRDEQDNANAAAAASTAAASHERFVPSFSPIPPSGTPYPYPYPFSHVRRVGGYVYPRASHPSQVPPPPPPSVPIHPGQIPSAIPRVPSSMYDYNTNGNGGGGDDANLAQLQLEEQFRLQMQMYAYNNALGDNGGAGGMMTDSTLSPSSTPYPGMSPGYTPFGAYLNQSRRFARARERAAVFNGGYGLPGPGEDGRVTGASMRSSPSHLPVSLPPMPPALYGAPRGRGVKKRDRVADLREEAVGGGGVGPDGGAKVNGVGGAAGAGARVKPPPRVDSTQPRETSPEPISEEDEDSGEETAGEKYEHGHREHVPPSRLPGYNHQTRDWGRRANGNNGNVNGMGRTRDNDGENDVGEWVDEESDEEEELLDLEFHPSYVTNADRRRRRWEQRWEDLTRAFQALDRETDTTLLVLASPAHTNKLYSLSSRSIRRDAQLLDGHAMHAARGAFTQIASRRRSARTQRRASLLERLYYASSLSTHAAPQSQDASASAAGEGERDAAASQAQNGSPESGAGTGADAAPAEMGEREEDLRRILRTALHSLSALHQMYEEREARWRIEERRMREEREGVDLLVRQAFGSTGPSGGAGGFMGMGGMGEQPFLPLP